MYFVDREKIMETLSFLNEQIKLFNKINDINNEFQRSTLERVAHVMIDCVLDVGNAMIDGFIMRDPGSYDDIIDILLDEKVITEDMSVIYKGMVRFRKTLVQQYMEVEHENLYQFILENLSAFQHFPEKIKTYLVNELGPVSAFKK